MFRNVVVGINGEESARDAVALAADLLARPAELTLVHVYPDTAFAWRGAIGTHGDDEDDHTRELVESARERTGVDVHLRWYPSSSVGHGLHEIADGLGADLLVIGASRRGPLGRALAGDDARAALSGAPCAVGIAPAGYGGPREEVHEIGVGYDGSAESELALAVARTIAAERHAGLSAMQVLTHPAYLFAEPVASDDESIDDLAGRTEPLSALEGVDARVVYGHPAEELARYSSFVDLLVVGSRGYGPVGRLVHGSTSRQLAHRAHSALLVLPRAAEEAESDRAAHGRGGVVTASAASDHGSPTSR